MGSGSDVVSGRDNGFESTTRMVGQRTTPDFTAFAGDVIFEVVGINHPFVGINATCTAIRGYGTNGEGSGVTPGGTGVWGMGGPNAGTGVFGQGGVVSLAPASSNGGIGVNGIGGDAGANNGGTGVLGQGGAGLNAGPDGAGVVGVGGSTPVPDSSLTAGSGVFGVSTTASGVHGRAESTSGVSGFCPRGLGVSGEGKIGVVGVSLGNGVGGLFSLGELVPTDVTMVPPNRAAVFGASTRAQKDLVAQVHLIPQEKPPFGASQPAAPGAYNTKQVAPALSAAGKAGDLLYTSPANQPGSPGSLWLCVISGTGKSNPARWQQVLLGPMFAASG